MPSTDSPASALTAAALVASAKQRVENLTVADVAAEIARGATIVDLREPDERHATGSIPGAVHAPRGMLEFWADPTSPYHRKEFDPAGRIILHCASGGRSALAADLLQQMGFGDVAHLVGGIRAWIDAGEAVIPVSPEC